LNIPREGRLNRLYIQLNSDSKANSFDREQVSPESMLKMAQHILSPYKIDFRYCDWWSIYRIGQRIAPNFSVGERIFLAGDAVHTHSPKLGQGLNVSMQDSYNLGWKLGNVITGRSPRTLLKSYEDERRKVALQLLAIDEEIARFYARDKTKVATSDGHDFGAIRERMYDFLSGAGVTYGQSNLVIKSKPELASGVKLGARLPSHQVLNQADAWPTELGDMLKSDGRWRLIVFAGDVTDTVQAKRGQQLGEALAASGSFLHRFTPTGKPIDEVIEVLTVHNAPRTAVNLLDLHEAFHPFDQERGWDYWKVFANDVPHHVPFVDAYARYGVGKEGCIVVCRPDQHVGYIGALEDVAELESYFSGVLIPQS
jgi:phenol 2-monooxygenase (NADPH)